MKSIWKFVITVFFLIGQCFAANFFTSSSRQNSYTKIDAPSRLQPGHHTITFTHTIREPVLMATDVNTEKIESVPGDYITVKVRRYKPSRWFCWSNYVENSLVVSKDGSVIFLSPEDQAVQFVYQSAQMKKPVKSSKFSRASFRLMTQLVLKQRRDGSYFFTHTGNDVL